MFAVAFSACGGVVVVEMGFVVVKLGFVGGVMRVMGLSCGWVVEVVDSFGYEDVYGVLIL